MKNDELVPKKQFLLKKKTKPHIKLCLFYIFYMNYRLLFYAIIIHISRCLWYTYGTYLSASGEPVISIS